MTPAQRAQKYRQTPKAKEAARAREQRPERKAKAAERRRKARAAATSARPFIAIDGEGITMNGDHKLVILAASDGAELITDSDQGLTTIQCLEWLMDVKRANPQGIFIGFGFGYDANMILKDIPQELLEMLHLSGSVQAGQWHITWKPNRQLLVRNNLTGCSICIWDVRGYWRSSFVKACHSVLGECAQIIEHGKNQRAEFTLEDLPYMVEYNRAELDYLVRIMDKVRASLHAIGIKPSRYDGAGSIASALLHAHMDLDALEIMPNNIQPIVRSAFYGGRIETIRYGHTDSSVFVYDMNSAYPAGLMNCPDWRGEWSPEYKPKQLKPHSLYLVEWDNQTSIYSPSPIPYRDPDSMSLSFPAAGMAWVWTPEAQVLKNLNIPHTVLEGRIFTPANPTARPFAWLQTVYDQRLKLSAEGNPAADLLKLGLAAVWGKLAQQTGWTDQPELKIPKWHHIASAGLATSHVRAQMMEACWVWQDEIIAFETDSVISMKELPVTLSNRMGDWNMKQFDNMTYLGSGVSWADADGKEWVRTAGVPRGQVHRELVLEAANKGEWNLPVTMTQFIGIGLASILPEGWKRFLNWEQGTYHLPLRPQGKRVPYAVLGNFEHEWSRMNPTFCPKMPDSCSSEYMIEWENPSQMLIDKQSRTKELESALGEALNY
jgi:hypothetical protein